MSNDASIENEDAAEYENEDTGFEQAPKALFIPGYDPGAPELPHPHDAVHLYLVLRHFGATANFKVRNEKIAEVMQCSVRHVQKVRQELIDAGWLLATPAYRTSGDHGQSANRYKVMWRRITGPDDPRAKAHAQRLEKIEADRIEGKRARRSGGTPPMFP
jgi:hypothetical protein